jgi:hypothetical protein
VAIRRRHERSCSKLRTSVRHEGQPGRVWPSGCEPRAESCRFQRVLMKTRRLQRLVKGAFPSPAGGASALRVTDWDKRDAAVHKSRDRRTAQARDKGVPVVRTTANVVLRAITSSFKLGSIQPKAFRVVRASAVTGWRASGSGRVGAQVTQRGYEGGSLGPTNWATGNVRSCGGAAALPAERRRGSSRGESPAKRPHTSEAGAAKNHAIALRTRGRETPTQNARNRRYMMMQNRLSGGRSRTGSEF